jgi:hypothetical protein
MKSRSRIPGLARLVAALAAALLLAAAGPAWAVDGVLEINQTCAVQTGCFAGDSAGLPVTIDASGSYRLTGSLTLADSNAVGISISASAVDVAIDLNGFGIACSSCAAPGSGFGIVTADPGSRVAVANGFVRGVGAAGILLLGPSRVDRVIASECWGVGIEVGDESIVTHSVARGNGASGIAGGDGCHLSRNVASGNGGYGILAAGCVLTQNAVTGNAVGLTVTGGTVADNVVESNTATGIVGISSIVRGNSVRSNGGYGLDPSGSTAYAENTFLNNNGGNANPQVGAGAIEIGPNVCGGDTTCP